MGTGIAYAFAGAGFETTLVDLDLARAAAAVERIAALAERAVARGRMAAGESPAIRARLRPATIADLEEGCDVVVESVPEDAALKAEVLRGIEPSNPTLLATNTSSIPIGSLAATLRDPERFVGLHFFNPVWSMPLIEIVVGIRTSASAVASAERTAALLGKEALVVRDAPGFATSRLGLAIGLEAMRMVEEGVAEPAVIDRAMELGYGFPMGPLRLSDLVGLDVRLGIARQLAVSLGERFAPPDILLAKVAAGELGKKARKGFYEWP
jgi:3-hydroxybutyryl-CoA dehydrogenase